MPEMDEQKDFQLEKYHSVKFQIDKLDSVYSKRYKSGAIKVDPL